jgi:pimeloyl-ACP methyl ester carboxylesterase
MVRVMFVRDHGRGVPVVHLHGGWGYEIYSAQRQIDALPDVRFVIPDRTGYGRSPPLAELPPRFHEAAAIETEGVIDRLGLGRCVLWGHSDGAVIAVIAALREPERYAGIVVEALHLEREKPRSREFFTTMAERPEDFGERIVATLRADHGERWADVLRMGGRAWLRIAATPGEDFFDHRLGELAVPTLAIHGADDPRTEPGELDRLRRDVPHARIELLPGAGHCPHAERRSADKVTQLLADFVSEIRTRF